MRRLTLESRVWDEANSNTDVCQLAACNILENNAPGVAESEGNSALSSPTLPRSTMPNQRHRQLKPRSPPRLAGPRSWP